MKVIAVPENTSGSGRPCEWHPATKFSLAYYSCKHAEVCSGCGKQFRQHFPWATQDARYSLRAEECPEFTPLPEGP